MPRLDEESAADMLSRLERSGLTTSTRRTSRSRMCNLHPLLLRRGSTKLVRPAVRGDTLNNLHPRDLIRLLLRLKGRMSHVQLVEFLLYVAFEQDDLDFISNRGSS